MREPSFLDVLLQETPNHLRQFQLWTATCSRRAKSVAVVDGNDDKDAVNTV